ncbi:MAG: CDP-alcohol phosphatidyltransferase family protein [Candidatus Freyarchaeota archaeon]|nr:CDP-alcohol phosphatidyltransferase family protein [Candidatus Freyrarchaeum guaymaensis]HDO81470.1 CDP-alcohol phosphatidyltransferase family protein [Candidatus Bathyarchaeota archaeon]
MLSKFKEALSSFFKPVAGMLLRFGVTPNHITITGFIASILSAMFIVGGRLDLLVLLGEGNRLITASILILASGLCDLLDGLVARLGGLVTAFGGFFDSVLDRYAEVIFLISLICMGYCSLLWGVIALSGSLLVSYARARGEAAGVSKMGIGIAERPERLLILGGATFLQGALFNNAITLPLIDFAVILIAVISHLTVLQRGYYAWRHLTEKHRS